MQGFAPWPQCGKPVGTWCFWFVVTARGHTLSPILDVNAWLSQWLPQQKPLSGWVVFASSGSHYLWTDPSIQAKNHLGMSIGLETCLTGIVNGWHSVS